MKTAFISDIHGNAIALESVLQDINNRGIDSIYVLGDLCFRGPEPKRSLELIRALNTQVIKGNADEWVVRGVREGEVRQTALKLMNIERDWTVSQLVQSDLDYLDHLPTNIQCKVNDVVIHGFHATPDSLFEVVAPNIEDHELETKLMKSVDANIYVYAHIHRPYIRTMNGKTIMNIGSVGLPFDGIPMSSYGIIEVDGSNVRTSIQRVAYDVERVVEMYKNVDYPNSEMMINIIRNAKV